MDDAWMTRRRGECALADVLGAHGRWLAGSGVDENPLIRLRHRRSMFFLVASNGGFIHIATTRKVYVRPAEPFGIVEQDRYCAVFVFLSAPMPMLRIRPNAVEDRVALRDGSRAFVSG
ncbi:MAG: hypothetical protein ABIQ70_07035 [Dokdonella sp.]